MGAGHARDIYFDSNHFNNMVLFTAFVLGFESFISPSLGELLSLLVQRRVTKETHPGALALRASLAERHLLQGRFDA
ncbi:MAG TPA: hypothetical protein VFY78_12295, partial [Gammaproteobacteria bacterium]|nr:hypothetical protein [Gammaproteobacteria bacterium]